MRLFDYSIKSPLASITAFTRPPNRPQHVPVQAGEVFLDSGNEGGLCCMDTSIGACFKVAPGPLVHWIKIEAAGRPHLLQDVSNRKIQIHPSFKLTFDTAALIWATVELEQRSIPFWKWHEDLVRVMAATHSLKRVSGFHMGP